MSRLWHKVLSNDLAILIFLALAKLGLHLLTNGQYGFHRDELGMLEDARYLAWGYVSYPPLTAFIARAELELFGSSLTGFRFFTALGQSIVMLLVGLMTRDLGGSRRAQIVASIAAATAPISLVWSSFFSYSGFDYLWWVLVAFLTIRLLKSEDNRYWPGIGAVLGLGMLTKYTIAFLAIGIAAGVLFTQARRTLSSPWFWSGVGLAVLIFSPNMIWQVQHNYIYLHFLSLIHQRDIQIGRTQGFLLDQLYITANPVAIPLWLAGLYYYFGTLPGRRFRMLGWMVAVPFILLLFARGRGYYAAPIYPFLISAGAVYGEGQFASLPGERSRAIQTTTWRSLAISGLLICALALPIAPVNSVWWKVARVLYSEPREEIGWPELVRTVAGIYAGLPEAEKPQTGILANYSEVGAINLYGQSYNLPKAIGGENSDWLRGYGDPPPQTLIVVGWSREKVDGFFRTCNLAGRVTNSYGVENEDTLYHADIFICRGLRLSWPEFWRQIRTFG